MFVTYKQTYMQSDIFVYTVTDSIMTHALFQRIPKTIVCQNELWHSVRLSVTMEIR
jgi:hypothetical protein